jgi:hypothetical protein
MKIISVAILIVVGLLFHNCSRVNLKKAELFVAASRSPNFLDAHICPQPNFGPNDSTKFVFIVDLSASNFGDWEQRLGGGWYFQPNLATDASGQRFTAINNFINTCGQNAQGDQFAVVGFSGGAGTLNNGVLSCLDTNFVTAATAVTEVNALATRQTLDYQNGYRQFETAAFQGTLPNGLVYTATSYSNATSCLEQLISDDLLDPNNTTDRYHVFFISDGVPKDVAGSGCEDASKYPTAAAKSQCYYNTSVSPLLMVRTAAASRGKELSLQGIYYGSNPTIPTVLNDLSIEGGTQSGVALQNFNNANVLCQFVAAPSAISYRPDVYMNINLTSGFIRGELTSDSDIDGISDLDEVLLGYAPNNPRSVVPGVLDGICRLVGGPAACLTDVQSSACDPTAFPGLGLLSNCDLRLLNLIAGAPPGDPGIDYDRDGLPDFIEVVKGLDPKAVDLASDIDGDGRTAREELLLGLDPFYAETSLDMNAVNSSSVGVSANSPYPATCTNGDWTLTANKIISSPTFQLQTGPLILNHAQNHQKVLLFYRSAPVNSQSPQLEYFVNFVDVQTDAVTGRPLATPTRVGPSDFQLLGRVQQ